MMLLKYQDGLRIVIHTANMIPDDWNLRTQGIWMSPKLKPASDVATTESPTNFRSDLISYLSAYGSRAIEGPSAPLKHWIDILNSYDFRPIRVYLVASVSGIHAGSCMNRFGHTRLRQLLRDSCPSSWPVIAQFSSIGSLGAQPTSWLTTEWSSSLAGRGARGIRLIYPCVEDVRNSLEGYRAGGCLPYSRTTDARQPWLRQFLHRWKASGHTRAAPHIKSYTRMSPDAKYIAWFLLTSANLSKAAWGVLQKNRTQLMTRSYELGVLFIPDCFQKGANCFRIKRSESPESKKPAVSDTMKPVNTSEPFPVPYDLPPVLYGEEDKPWLVDETYAAPDGCGNTWNPR